LNCSVAGLSSVKAFSSLIEAWTNNVLEWIILLKKEISLQRRGKYN